jgi:hypothetical protein
MQTHSSSKSPSNEAPPLLIANHGQKAVNPTTEPARKPVEKCHWTATKEECLILFLVSKKSEAGNGGSFKSVTWTAAVQEMAKIPPVKGLVKNSAACSLKYGRVCTTLCRLPLTKHLAAPYSIQSSYHSERPFWDRVQVYHRVGDEYWCCRAVSVEGVYNGAFHNLITIQNLTKVDRNILRALYSRTRVSLSTI